MKKNLLKTALLLLVSLVSPQNIFAESVDLKPTQTTRIQANGSSETNADVVFYDASATSWVCSYATISNGAFTNKLASWGGTPVVLTKFDASSTLTGKTVTKATLTFKSICNVSGYNSNVQVAQVNTGWDATKATWNNTNTSAILGAVNINGDGTNVTSAKEVTLTIDVTDNLKASTDNTIGFGIYTKTGREQKVYDFNLAVEYVDASSSASYTIKFVDQDGNEIKESVTYTDAIDAAISLKDDDKVAVYNTDKTKKYVYASDDSEGKTVAKDGSTVVTVKFREAATWSYTFNAVDGDGNILKENIANGSNFEGETFNVAYPYALNFDGTLYTSDRQNKGFYIVLTLSENGLTKNITYKASDIKNVVYFSEAEDIDGLTRTNNNNTGIRSSNGASAYAATADVEFVKLPAGKYTLTTVICDASSGAGSVWNFKAGNDTVFTFTATSVNWSQGTSDEFALTGETGISLCKGGNSNKGVDLIYIQCTGITKTISSTHFASYSASSNTTVPEGVSVYKAKVDGSSVVLTKVETNVIPANTGVILYSETEGEKVFSVTTEGSDASFDGNELIATSVAENATVPSDGTYYALSATDKVFGVLKGGITLSGNKAYIKAPTMSGEAKTLSIDFGGDTTGISNTVVKTSETDGAYYTLQGVKTLKPAKGLYIHNGKKVIVK